MKQAIVTALCIRFMPVFGIEYTQRDRDVLVEIRAKMHEIDKRFEQIDKRFNFQQSILIVMLAVLMGPPLLVDYLARACTERPENCQCVQGWVALAHRATF